MNRKQQILDWADKGVSVCEIAAFLKMAKSRVQQIVEHRGYPWRVCHTIKMPSESASSPWIAGDLPWNQSIQKGVNLCARI